MVKVNDEPTYPHFFHEVTVSAIQALEISGQADISYVGFGPKDLTPAPVLRPTLSCAINHRTSRKLTPEYESKDHQ